MEYTLTLNDTLHSDLKKHTEIYDVSLNEIVETALEQYLSHYSQAENKIINQGDIYWAKLPHHSAIPHPYVVVQDDLFNHSRIDTTVICALTSNRDRANRQGNVLLDKEEANLSKQSVVEVSKISSINKNQLGEYVGTLSKQRVDQILSGIKFLQSYYR